MLVIARITTSAAISANVSLEAMEVEWINIFTKWSIRSCANGDICNNLTVYFWHVTLWTTWKRLPSRFTPMPVVWVMWTSPNRTLAWTTTSIRSTQLVTLKSAKSNGTWTFQIHVRRIDIVQECRSAQPWSHSYSASILLWRSEQSFLPCVVCMENANVPTTFPETPLR